MRELMFGEIEDRVKKLGFGFSADLSVGRVRLSTSQNWTDVPFDAPWDAILSKAETEAKSAGDVWRIVHPYSYHHSDSCQHWVCSGSKKR